SFCTCSRSTTRRGAPSVRSARCSGSPSRASRSCTPRPFTACARPSGANDMGDGIYVALSGAIAQSVNLDTTASNLANASTDGYQRARPVFREELTKAGTHDPGFHYTSVAGTALDTTRGPLRATGKPLDF